VIVSPAHRTAAVRVTFLLVILMMPGVDTGHADGGVRDFVGRLDEAIHRVEAVQASGAPLPDPAGFFPEQERIAGPWGVVPVEHAGLRAEWSRLPVEESARREALVRLRHRLLAIRAEVVSTAAAAGATPPSGWREKLTGVLARPEFQKRQAAEDWRARIFQWLWDKLSGLFPRGTPDAVGDALTRVLYALAGLTLAVVLFILVRTALPLFSRERRTGTRTASPAPPVETQDSLWARADNRTRAGDLRGAAQALFRWMLLGLHRAGRLDYDPALTNREHLVRLKAEAGLRAAFERLSRQYELIWYGFQPVAPEEYAAFRTECQRLTGGRR